jgi:hypothetical protein
VVGLAQFNDELTRGGLLGLQARPRTRVDEELRIGGAPEVVAHDLERAR